MSTLAEDITAIEDAKRTLKFQIGNDELANKLHQIGFKMRHMAQVLEQYGADQLPYDRLLELQTLFRITDAGIDIMGLFVSEYAEDNSSTDGKPN